MRSAGVPTLSHACAREGNRLRTCASRAEGGEADGPADAKTSVFTPLDGAGGWDSREVDESIGTGEILANAHDEVGAAAEGRRPRLRELTPCVVVRRRSAVRELVYHPSELETRDFGTRQQAMSNVGSDHGRSFRIEFSGRDVRAGTVRRLRAWRLAALMVVVSAAVACTGRDAASGAAASADAATGDSSVASASPASPVASAESDTALSTGVGSLQGSIDSALAATQRRIRPRARARPRVIPPLADTIAEKLVFPPVTQSWFLAAARGKRMLIDIGRVDVEVRRDPKRLEAYKLAVDARSPFPTGTRFRLRGPWGADDATITGFDTWNGRIVATVATSALVDSLAAAVEPLPATAQLVDSAAAAVSDTGCVRGALPPALEARVKVVRDSLEQLLRTTEKPPYERLMKSLKSRSSSAAGCFPRGRVVVIATMWAGEYEWVREIVVLLDDAGALSPLRLRDYRFRGHEAIYALDGDGDGVDDLATRGYGPNLGGTSVLRIEEGRTPKEPRRLERMATGFAWEIR